MSANESLSPIQFIDHRQLGKMWSDDHEARMSRVKFSMQSMWERDNDGTNEDFTESGNGDFEHNGPDNYIKYLKQDIAKNGFKEPIEIRAGGVVDGHHRGVAALEMKHTKIPVREV